MFTLHLAADHRGTTLLENLTKRLENDGHRIVRHDSPEIVDDYPRAAQAIAKAIQTDPQARGVLVCGSGVGVCMAANRFKGIYAAVAHSTEEIRTALEHDHINVLCLGADTTSDDDAYAYVQAWLGATPDTQEHRERRLQQTDEYGS